MEGDIAPRFVVPSTTILMLGSIPGLRRFFCIRRFLPVRRFLDRLRFALRAHGFRRLLQRDYYISAPCGWEQGAKRDHIRVGSGLGWNQERQAGACFFVPAFDG